MYHSNTERYRLFFKNVKLRNTNNSCEAVEFAGSKTAILRLDGEANYIVQDGNDVIISPIPNTTSSSRLSSWMT